MWRRGLLVAGGVFALDQLTKWVILTQVMDPPTTIPVTGFFELVLAWNRGVSFSMFASDWGPQPYVLAGLALAVSLGLAIWLRKADSWIMAAGLGAIIGGAVGNAVDRLRLGAVVDFLHFHWNEYYFPAFNIADSAITVGVGLLLLDGLFGNLGRPKPRPRP
ncbi:MAG: signal peptidase II [Dongiaceae bacterium]|jgi:signal peptidase II